MPSIEQIQAEWARLEAEYSPRIAEARQEVEAASAAFDEALARRNATVDRHGKLVASYNDAWEVVGKTGGR